VTITEESVAVLEAYRLSQVALQQEIAADVAAIMPFLDFDNLADSWSGVERLMVGVTNARHAESVQLSQSFYRSVRTAEGITGPFTLRGADPLDAKTLVQNLRIVGPGHAGEAIWAGRTDVYDTTFSKLRGEVGRNALNGGRSSVLNTTRSDRKAVGWVRVTDGNPCAFCRMLASRGPVYKKSGSISTGDFKAHPKCACVAKPVYSEEDPWPGKGEKFRQEWDEATAGFSGNDALNAYRRYIAARA